MIILASLHAYGIAKCRSSLACLYSTAVANSSTHSPAPTGISAVSAYTVECSNFTVLGSNVIVLDGVRASHAMMQDRSRRPQSSTCIVLFIVKRLCVMFLRYFLTFNVALIRSGSCSSFSRSTVRENSSANHSTLLMKCTASFRSSGRKYPIAPSKAFLAMSRSR